MARTNEKSLGPRFRGDERELDGRLAANGVKVLVRRQARLTLGGGDGVAQEAGHGHWADAVGNGGDGAGDRQGLLERHVAHHLGAAGRRFDGIADEMTLTLESSAWTSILALAHDYSCAIYGADGQQIGYHADDIDGDHESGDGGCKPRARAATAMLPRQQQP